MEAATVGKSWLSYREPMEDTGLGRTLLTKLVTTGEIPAARVGRRVLISREGLDSYLESQSYADTEEVDYVER